MGAGRPPLPTAIKKLQGTDRADRGVKNEMIPSTLEYAPSPPSALTRDGKKVWASVCSELVRLNMLHRVDLELLGAYCNEMALYWEASRAIKKEGAVIRYSKTESLAIEVKDGKVGDIKKVDNGYPMQNPWVQVRNTALKNSRELANQFGFTPSARARLSVAPPEDTDPLDEILNS